MILKVLEDQKNTPVSALTPEALPLFAAAGTSLRGVESDEAIQSEKNFSSESPHPIPLPEGEGASAASNGELVEKLTAINPDDMSPKEALEALYELKGVLRQ
jgi:hypothetical protein